MQSSSALVHAAFACLLVGLVASDEHAPALALYVPSAGLQPVAVPGPQTMPAAPQSVPEAPVASPNFIMPMQSPGAQMPGAPAPPVIMMPAPVDAPGTQTGTPMFAGFFWGLASSFAIGFTITAKRVYDGMKSSVVSQKGGAGDLELGVLSGRAGVPLMAASAITDSGRAGVPTMAAKKPAAKKPVAKKVVAKKVVAKKAVAKKPVAKKPVAKKVVAKKPVAKKPVVKKPVAKKVVAQKPRPKKMQIKRAPVKPLGPSAIKLGDIGTTKPLGVYDPLNLMSKMPNKYRRFQEMEIKHGRFAMAACTHVFLTEAGVRWPGYLSYAEDIKFSDMPGGTIASWAALPTLAWVQIVLIVAILDNSILAQDPAKAPGDVAGKFWVRYEDKDTKEFKLNVERNNGRAAMMGIFGMVIHEALTGNPLFPIAVPPQPVLQLAIDDIEKGPARVGSFVLASLGMTLVGGIGAILEFNKKSQQDQGVRAR